MSTMKVERPVETDSWAWILVQTRSNAGIMAETAGTKQPLNAKITIIPTCFTKN